MAHPNKAIRGAIDYAIRNGWRFVKSGPRAHTYGRLYCPAAQRGGCIVSVYGTPKNPEKHARFVRDEVDGCPHGAGDDR